MKDDEMITVSQNGKIVDSSKYDWNSETKTFSTNESNLVLDFCSIGNVTIKCGSNCTIDCGSFCTINCVDFFTIKSGNWCNINCGDYCTINCGSYCDIHCGDSCNIKCGSYSTIKCGSYSTINCGSNCAIHCGSDCNIRTYFNNIIFPGMDCGIHFQHNEIFTLEKLIENEFQQIIETGELIKLKEIEYTGISLKENVFTYVLKNGRKFNFYIEDEQNEELMKAILEDNHTKILMLENENNNQFIKHFLKTFKKAN